MPGETVPRLESFASPEALPPDIDVLFDAAPDLFSRAAWWRAVLAHAMPDGTQACFLLCRIGAMPAALFPLRRPSSGRSLDSLTTPYTCRYAPLLHPALDDAARLAVFTAFGRFCRDWATTRLDALPADWPALGACMDGAHAAGLAVRQFDHFGNWHETVAGMDWSGLSRGAPGRAARDHPPPAAARRARPGRQVQHRRRGRRTGEPASPGSKRFTPEAGRNRSRSRSSTPG